MKCKLDFISLLILLFLIPSTLYCQNFRVSGHIHDKENNPLTGASIFLKPDGKQLNSDKSGNYSITSSSGFKHLTARLLGFKTITLEFRLKSDTIIDLYLQVSPLELNEVQIFSDSARYVKITQSGSIVITPASIKETPKIFSEPDLFKSLQLLPGVVSGKEGTADLYVRGGGSGQNIILSYGCYFFMPGHLLGIVSPYDLDFLESAELFKDYLPSEIGGGAASVLNIEFRKVRSDSLSAQFRFGLLTSGLNIETPVGKTNWHLTAGIRRGNYGIYAPVLKKIVSEDVRNLLPEKYRFYDGFMKLSYSSQSFGQLSYLFFGNYDNSKDENKYSGVNGDTLTNYIDGVASGWNSMVHALQWELPRKKSLDWKFNLNYNRLAIGRNIYSDSKTFGSNSHLIASGYTHLTFYPSINNIGASAQVTRKVDKVTITAGLAERFRSFSSNNFAENSINDAVTRNELSSNDHTNELSVYFSSSFPVANKIQINAGLRLSGAIIKEATFFNAEPRFRISYNPAGPVSPHINYVRLSQNDHSLEGSNAGLRTMLWVPLYKDFGPEVSDILSAGFRGSINNDFEWSVDGYLKNFTNMVDFKPGASFIYDTSFVDMLDKIHGKAYGIESSIIKKSGKLSGSLSYTYSRSKRVWYPPEGKIWIPSISDRPHNFNVALKYNLRKKTSFGLTFVYLSGSPATIFMHETSYGEFFETKNNIRYFDYNRLDLALRHVIIKKRFIFFLDADIYNVYNRKNTFYFRKTYNEPEQRFYFKNISLFPIMPTLTLTIKY